MKPMNRFVHVIEKSNKRKLGGFAEEVIEAIAEVA
jgi:hypothetical protein